MGTAYVWFAPQFFTRSSHQGDVLILAMFVFIGLSTAALFETLKRRTARAEQAERQAVRLSMELRAADNRFLAAERTARQEAERANRLKNQILSMVSHELRTPLGAILGWTDMLKRGTMDEVSRDRALEAIRRNAQLQVQLVGELLDLARIESGTVQLNYDRVNLCQVINDAWDDIAPSAHAKGIQSSIDVDLGVLANPLYGDPTRLQQIVANLFSNAVKFTPVGGRVSARVQQVDGSVEIVITDTGRGIPADFLPFVFEPFRQADVSGTNPDGGLGLGLSIVKQLVEAHQGEVRVASDGEGHGARFTVRLPLRTELSDRRAPSRAMA
jgi:signal transduction histidine kinase